MRWTSSPLAVRTATAASVLLLVAIGAAPAAAAETREVKLDLNKLSRERTETLRVPAGEMFRVRLDNRAPAVGYRYLVEEEGAPPPRWLEITPLPASATRRLDISPACSALQNKIEAVAAARREAEVPALVAALEKTLAEHGCPQLEATIASVLQMAVNSEVRSTTLQPFKRMKITIERLDPASNSAVARWQVEIEGAPAAVFSRYRTETEWLVGEVATDLAEMAALGLGRPAAGPAEVRTESAENYTVTVRPWVPAEVRSTVSFAGQYAWSPKAFAPVASALLPARPRASAPAADTSALKALLEPTPEAIVAEDRRASERLGHDLLSADAHEHAALVVATLALRESAGSFSDLRPLLCRLAAHLALARALRSSEAISPNGFWAEVALLTLAGRDAEALALAERAKATGSRQDEWRRALALRITGDWREFTQGDNATLLEWREAFRASIRRRGDLFALDLMRKPRPPNVADWGRLLLSSPFLVAVANTFAPAAVADEVDEATRVFKAYSGRELAPGHTVTELNGPGARAVTSLSGRRVVAVLGWAQWAPFLRRHLQLALDAEVSALADNLGDHEAAREAAAKQDARFSSLEGYWRILAARPSLEKKDQKPSPPTGYAPPPPRPECAGVSAAVKARPETVSFRDWERAHRVCPRERDTGALPDPELWFQPGMPPGTAFDAGARLRSKLVVAYPLPVVEELHRGSPYDRSIAGLLGVRRFGSNMKPQELQGVLGPLLEYDTPAARDVLQVAIQTDTDVGIWQERLCAMDADACIQAGFYFGARGEDARALHAFERALAEARDPVGVANEVNWPVDYYLDHGRQEDALRVATFAANAYSEEGLRTMGRLQERLRRYDEAIMWYRRIAERYEDSSHLDEFYVRYRQRVGDGRYEAEARAALQKLFPQGLTRAALGDFRQAPTSGLPEGWRVTGMTEKLRRVGLREGDVVVAADGFRVRDGNQWVAIRSFRDDPAVSLIVWRGGGYMELTGPYVRQKFGPP